MKVAEALAERKALQDRLASLTTRARKNVLVTEGRQPLESPDTLLKEITATLELWEKRVVQINRANSQIILPNGMTLMEAIIRRDAITRHIGVYSGLLSVDGSPEWRGMVPHEVRPMIPAIDLSLLQQKVDDLTMERMNLDLAIQEAGWTHELLED